MKEYWPYLVAFILWGIITGLIGMVALHFILKFW